MWKLDRTSAFDRRSKQYQKDYPREWEGAMANANTYHVALNAGVNPIQIAKSYGFVRSEGKEVYRVNQGKGQGKAQVRLYLYADLNSKCLWLLNMGDKKCQGDDIKECHRLVALIKQENKIENDHEQGKGDGREGEDSKEASEVQEHRGADSEPIGGH